MIVSCHIICAEPPCSGPAIVVLWPFTGPHLIIDHHRSSYDLHHNHDHHHPIYDHHHIIITRSTGFRMNVCPWTLTTTLRVVVWVHAKGGSPTGSPRHNRPRYLVPPPPRRLPLGLDLPYAKQAYSPQRRWGRTLACEAAPEGP